MAYDPVKERLKKEISIQRLAEARGIKLRREAKRYLEKRGLQSAELVEHFQLGFSDRMLGPALPDRNRLAGAELRGQLERLGIFRPSGHERMRGSLVVPILNLEGDVVQMYGRKINDNLRAGTEYHMYLPGPMRGVWNEEAFIASKEIILCESLIDAMTFWCAGYRNVTASYGFTQTSIYAPGPSGEQLEEADGSYNLIHANVFLDGNVLATYSGSGYAQTNWHYSLNDWLGSRRLQVNANGTSEGGFMTLPYGDGFTTTADPGATEHQFTGKERDSESGLDYFGARYYGSSMGRFMSPDPILQNDLRLLNPQRWNKYSYAINNPLTLTDPTGKDAAYVNFSGMAHGYGHAGILSIHPGTGDATYSRFGPKSAGQAVGAGEVQTDYELPTVQFGADGLPTPASYAALIQAVADYENVNPDTVAIDYFKTTDSETAIWTNTSSSGKLLLMLASLQTTVLLVVVAEIIL